ncbi:MAG: hypothetical protein PHT67_03100, partial [Candidatus Pacebacteria bacterium]|nr:hypothetical protein [Candidatus Paceibacterota bacterium]
MYNPLFSESVQAELTDGVCGVSHMGTFESAPSSDLCDAGTPSEVTGTGPWDWVCSGIDGGADANCYA